jgi:hypothetical protein
MATEDIDNRTAALAAVIVNPGRTVCRGEGHARVGAGLEVVQTTYSEGETLQLPRDEAERLRVLGFVHYEDEEVAFTRPLGVGRDTGAAPTVNRQPEIGAGGVHE